MTNTNIHDAFVNLARSNTYKNGMMRLVQLTPAHIVMSPWRTAQYASSSLDTHDAWSDTQIKDMTVTQRPQFCHIKGDDYIHIFQSAKWFHSTTRPLTIGRNIRRFFGTLKLFLWNGYVPFFPLTRSYNTYARFLGGGNSTHPELG